MHPFRGIIAAGVRNPVFVNLLMFCVLAAGVISARRMVRESYPEFSLDHIAIEVPYPGASAFDVERAICTPVEAALRGLPGVRKISSSANEDFGTVWVGLLSSVKDPAPIIQEIKDRVGQITDWPDDAEEPIIRETVVRTEVINVAIHGDVPERTLKQFAREVENDLTTFPEISQVALSGVRDDEITIEVSEEALRAYNLSLAQVMDVVARSSLDLPAGVIRTAEEEVTLRVTGQRFRAVDYEDLVVLEHGDAVVRLREIARVREGFEDAVVRGRFNDEPAAVVQVFKTPDQDSTRIARIVRDYVARRQDGLPDTLHMSVWGDTARDIDGRIRMLVVNGIAGITLVFLVLWTFLEVRTAWWVAVGIPIAFAGALAIMHVVGESLNLISLFGLIIVSGIIVDDAIVVAEAIHSRRRAGMRPDLAAIDGTAAMALPVLGSSITTIIAFVPLMFVVGVMGKFIHVLPVVVIAAIVMSGVEAFIVLPAHLSHRATHGASRGPSRARRAIDDAIDHVLVQWYRPLLARALAYRAVTIAIAMGAMLVVVGMVVSGRTPLVVFPREDGNVLRARVRLPQGTPVAVTERVIARIEAAALALNDDPTLAPAAEGPLVLQIHSILGEFADFLPARGSHLGETRIELMPAGKRRLHDEEIMAAWRKHIGVIHDVTEFRIERQQIGPTDRPIEIRLLGSDLEDLAAASERIQEKLREFDGVIDVTDDLIPGKRELRVTLSQSARTLGLTLDDVARQLRYGFYGGEAVRVYRGSDQVKVRVRLPDEERRSIADLEAMRIKTPLGHEVPFLEVAHIEWARGFNYIMHQDGKRRVRVLADVTERTANAERIVQTLQAGFLDDVVRDYSDVTWELGGDRERMDESLFSLYRGFALAIIGIYTMLGAMLRSYVQPIVILITMPLGLIGAVVGHAVMGLDLTLMSLFGVVALSGVVLNDAIVLLDAVNNNVRKGKGLVSSLHAAGEERFRAVWITSITTIVGLGPLLLERSSQAQPVIPMAVSITWGLLFATALTLFVVPALYLTVNDARRFLRWLRRGGAYPKPEAVEEAACEEWTTAASS